MAADGSRAPAVAKQANASSIADVSLSEGGTLSGQVLNPQGGPLTQTVVTVHSPIAQVASAVTDVQGNFSIHGLQGGVYQIKCGESSGAFRLWTAGTSPPSANKGLMVVVGGPIDRGQSPRPIGCPTNGQVVMATLLILGSAGAIVAIAEGKQEQPSGS
jgi:hypothetical protein